MVELRPKALPAESAAFFFFGGKTKAEFYGHGTIQLFIPTR
jgi:hypothetical protein